MLYCRKQTSTFITWRIRQESGMSFGKEVSPDVGKDTQFQPGVSGNPSGKPKGTKNLATHIQEMLSDEDFTTYLTDPKDGWREFKGAPVKAIVQTALVRAIQGDDKAREWLAKYGYGQKMTLANDVENPITDTVPVTPELTEKWLEFLKGQTKDD